MKRSLSLTLLAIAGFMLFSIASCGGSSEREYAQADYSYDYEDESYADYGEEETVQAKFKVFPIYTDGRSPDNHYIPAGYMGDSPDIALEISSFVDPHAGTTCIKIVYSNAVTQGARWAGIYWQNPANNWGDRLGGFDLTGATKLSFWARGELGGERVEEFKIGGIAGMYPDTDIAGIGPVLLTKDWKKYEIDLRGKDLSYINGGFCWSSNIDVNPEGITFYLDDIRYE